MTGYGPPPVQLTARQTALRTAAFRLLLERHEPVAPQLLANALGAPVEDVARDLQVLDDTGRVKLDGGAVLGSLGLTLVPTNHRINIDGAEWNTWCALDALGILGALAVDGWIESTNPVTGDRFHIRTVKGVPDGYEASHVLFLADQSPVASVIDQWCPQVNFFVDEASAQAWAAGAGARGRCFDIPAAAELATRLWQPLLAPEPSVAPGPSAL
jgi:alkylmercury lyase-like protein